MLEKSTGEGIGYPLQYSWASLVAQLVRNQLAMWETWFWSLGWEDPLEKGKAVHSGILAWRIPWTLQTMGVAESDMPEWLSLMPPFPTLDINPASCCSHLPMLGHLSFQWLQCPFPSKIYSVVFQVLIQISLSPDSLFTPLTLPCKLNNSQFILPLLLPYSGLSW